MSSESVKQMWKEIFEESLFRSFCEANGLLQNERKPEQKAWGDEIFEEGFRAYCEANRLLERDLSCGLANERIPAKEEQEARESYYEYMKRRSREEDEKMRLAAQEEIDAFVVEEEKRSRSLPSAKDVLSNDTMDGIAKDALIWHRTEVLDDLIAAEDNDKVWGARYVHHEDVHWKRDLLKAMNVVLEYFGEGGKGTLDRRKERELPCPQCGMYGQHKMDCTNG